MSMNPPNDGSPGAKQPPSPPKKLPQQPVPQKQTEEPKRKAKKKRSAQDEIRTLERQLEDSRKMLVEAIIPLSALTMTIQRKPFVEMSKDLQNAIVNTCRKVSDFIVETSKK